MGVPLFENVNKMHHVKVVTNTAHFYLMELELGIITGPYPIQSENLYLVINEKQEMSLLSSLFNEHISNKINKWNKIIGIMKKLSPFQSRKTLLTIYKSFVRPNFDYADSYNLCKLDLTLITLIAIIYENLFNDPSKLKWNDPISSSSCYDRGS